MSDHTIYFDLMTLNWKEAFKLCFVDDNWSYRLEENIQQEKKKKKSLAADGRSFVFCGPNATAKLTNAISLILRECPLGRCRRPGSSSCHMLLLLLFSLRSSINI